MDKELFAGLVESIKQMDEIIRGEREPSRVIGIDDDGRRVLTGTEARAAIAESANRSE